MILFAPLGTYYSPWQFISTACMQSDGDDDESSHSESQKSQVTARLATPTMANRIEAMVMQLAAADQSEHTNYLYNSSISDQRYSSFEHMHFVYFILFFFFSICGSRALAPLPHAHFFSCSAFQFYNVHIFTLITVAGIECGAEREGKMPT